ncbi:hypothetical protein TVAG_285510 [Trichomonas vaginalis G3]|uniref:DUF3447 domain-containing protein n=1 Tax=Trichomonas vaginalis (strain ATCC PRA-98 / G3) TaxID=412133 RepID=A2FUA9_TRIV3|nr:spectrin binding [Trichomonas vaginalis G3]EAX91499.1 hypothetical protein TVAG_285510 [Trichomonas vaginalis G3]KAI5485038.1 spectrin binding [Trichomonas vaginalis G3]|eukprot:XP_001304429.1 hypothetical protein [Trichomonas vaginalis G3]
MDFSELPYAAPYKDYIDVFEKLFNLTPEEDMNVFLDQIKNVLVNKYHIDMKNFFYNQGYLLLDTNFKAVDKYNFLFEHFDAYPPVNIECNYLIKKFFLNDNIEEFKKYIVDNPLPASLYFCEKYITPFKACCKFGAVNTFNFIRNNMPDFNELLDISLFREVVKGKNLDMINEFLKNNIRFDGQCVQTMIQTHQHELFEFFLKCVDLDQFPDFKPVNYVFSIQTCHNLAAVFLLHEHKLPVFPWCVIFPETKMLCNQGIPKLTRLDARVNSILHWVFKSRDIDWIKYVITTFPTFEEDINGLLEDAIMEQKNYEALLYQILEFYFELNIDPNVQGYYGAFPIIALTYIDTNQQNPELVDDYIIKLIEKGANFWIRDNHGYTAVEIFCRCNHFKTIVYLLQNRLITLDNIYEDTQLALQQYLINKNITL